MDPRMKAYQIFYTHEVDLVSLCSVLLIAVKLKGFDIVSKLDGAAEPKRTEYSRDTRTQCTSSAQHIFLHRSRS